MEYPHGWDYEWFAVDQIGQVARFTTAGVGPIPRIVLPQIEFVDEILDKLYEGPQSSQAIMLEQLPCPEDFLEIAGLGIFGYDWSDVHKTGPGTNAYQPISLPTCPKSIDGFSVEFRKLSESVRLRTLTFGADIEVDIDSLFECAWP